MIKNYKAKLFLRSVVREFKDIKTIISLYVYGSVLTKDFNQKRSDIDLLFIVKDIQNPKSFIDEIKSKLKQFHDFKLDANIVFLSEFKERWHIYRPPSYFIGIKHRSKLIYGKDLIKQVKDNEMTVDLVYKRIVDLAQSSRGIYLNNKEVRFWKKKYIKWLKIAVLEFLFLIDDLDLNFQSGLKKIKLIYPELFFLDILNKDKISMKEINDVTEKLRLFILNKYIRIKL